jgi:hypothetical protein
VIYKGSLIYSSLGFNKFGSRLRDYSKKEIKLKIKDVLEFFLLLSVVLILSTLLFKNFYLVPEFLYIDLLDIGSFVKAIISYTLVASPLCLSFLFFRFKTKGFNLRFKKNRLPEFPKQKNTIVLGSSCEESDFDQDLEGDGPLWVEADENVLKENFLVTGLIGSGKTSGLLIPMIKQIIENFDNYFLCVLDPKNTLVHEVLKYIEDLNTGAVNVYHIKLDGDVKLNPLWIPNALETGAYQDIANMIASATANFSGGGVSQDPYWEIQGTTLIKNTIIYCLSVYKDGYFTFTDLKEALTKAILGELTEELSSLVENIEEGERKYSAAEVHNINSAKKYFEGEFEGLGENAKGSIYTTATTFLNSLEDYRIGKVFCPKREDITFSSFDEITKKQGVLLFDIESEAVARAMGTIIKLQFQRAILDRTKDKNFKTKNLPLAFNVIDEYQCIVSSGGKRGLGDERYLSMSREALGVTIAATQSVTSLENQIGSKPATKELLQNFRSHIACASTDEQTTQSMISIAGKKEVIKEGRSVNESASNPNKTSITQGNYESGKFSLSETLSFNKEKKDRIGKADFSHLGKFEAFCFLSGIKPKFLKLYLKPAFLEKKETLHKDLIKSLGLLLLGLGFFYAPLKAEAYPNLCSIIKGKKFDSCYKYKQSECSCGFPPRPCAKHAYRIPRYFIEVTSNPDKSFFHGLPISISEKSFRQGHNEGSDSSYFFHVRVASIPFSYLFLNTLTCAQADFSLPCVISSSVSLKGEWTTGLKDSSQPAYLAWKSSPGLCEKKGAVTSSGLINVNYPAFSYRCNSKPVFKSKNPPGLRPQCTQWGNLYPRVGYVNTNNPINASLLSALRFQTLSNEVYLSVPSSRSDVWQMLYPSQSSCFKVGKNLFRAEMQNGVKENIKKRLFELKRHGQYLFVVWKKVSCCKDINTIATHKIVENALKLACSGMGDF